MSDKAWVQYPACWQHRWLWMPRLRLISARDGRVVLDGVSAEFLASWEGTHDLADNPAAHGPAADTNGKPAV